MRILKLVLIVMLALGVTNAFAGEGKFGFQMFSGFAFENYEDLGTDGGRLQLDRFLVSYGYTFSKNVKVKVTYDVLDSITRSYKADALAAGTDGFIGLLGAFRELYAEFNADYGIVKLTTKTGLIPGSLVSRIYGRQGDLFMSTTSAMDITKTTAIGGANYQLDQAADAGAELSLNIAKMVNVGVSLTNGGGYKNLALSALDYNTSVAVFADVTPIKNLNVNAFYKWNQGTSATDIHAFSIGAAWLTKSIKGGVTYVGVYSQSFDTMSQIFDIFANVNLKEFIGLPVLVMGKVGLSIQDMTKIAGQTSDIGLHLIGGAGYKISDNTKAVITYEWTGGDTHNIALKMESKI